MEHSLEGVLANLAAALTVIRIGCVLTAIELSFYNHHF